MKKSKIIMAIGFFMLSLAVTARAAEIHEAVKAGNLAAVKAVIEKDPGQLKVKDENGLTPLHWAARGTNNEILAYLIDRGGDLNALDNNGLAALHGLAYYGNTDGIRILLAKGADVDIKAPDGSTPLHYAALAKKVEAIRLLVENKAKIESRNAYSRTPLVSAAREMAGPAVIRALLDLGADIDSADRSGDTALSLAAWRGSADVVDLLLEKNASFPVKTTKGREILEYAVSKGLSGLFARMVEKGADVAVEVGNRGTLLHAAAEGGSVPTIEILLEKGLKIDQKDAYGWTPLHFAADMGRAAAIEALLSKGADIQARTIIGQSAYNLAEDNGDKEMMAFLAGRGFDPSPARFPELAGEYLGQKTPGKKAELFAPGIVTGRYSLHGNIVFSPDGKEACWSMMIPPRTVGYSTDRVVVSRLVEGKWTYPRKAVFGGTAISDVPFYHPGGEHLFDMSRRPLPGGGGAGKENIWIWDKGGEGWTNPQPLNALINSLPQHWQFCVDREGSVYFSTNIPGSLGQGDLYVSRFSDGRHQKPENLGPAVNSPESEGFPFIAPDGRYLLFERNMDIWVSFRQTDGSWGKAVRLGSEVNTPGREILPIVSPDGRYLFFCRGFGSFWIDASVIEDMKPKEPAPARQAERLPD